METFCSITMQPPLFELTLKAIPLHFIKHKMIHTELRSSLVGTTVEKMLFIRYNIKHADPDLPFFG